MYVCMHVFMYICNGYICMHVYMVAGPNTGFEFGGRYECIKLLEHNKRQKIVDKSFVFCFIVSLDKHAFL